MFNHPSSGLSFSSAFALGIRWAVGPALEISAVTPAAIAISAEELQKLHQVFRLIDGFPRTTLFTH